MPPDGMIGTVMGANTDQSPDTAERCRHRHKFFCSILLQVRQSGTFSSGSPFVAQAGHQPDDAAAAHSGRYLATPALPSMAMSSKMRNMDASSGTPANSHTIP